MQMRIVTPYFLQALRLLQLLQLRSAKMVWQHFYQQHQSAEDGDRESSMRSAPVEANFPEEIRFKNAPVKKKILKGKRATAK